MSSTAPSDIIFFEKRKRELEPKYNAFLEVKEEWEFINSVLDYYRKKNGNSDTNEAKIKGSTIIDYVLNAVGYSPTGITGEDVVLALSTIYPKKSVKQLKELVRPIITDLKKPGGPLKVLSGTGKRGSPYRYTRV